MLGFTGGAQKYNLLHKAGGRVVNFGENINEKLKGVVKKDKKIEYSKYKNPICEAIFVIIFNAMRKKISLLRLVQTRIKIAILILFIVTSILIIDLEQKKPSLF